MRELINEIQLPYSPLIPGSFNDQGCQSMDKAYRVIMHPPSIEWHDYVMNRLEQCQYSIPDYVHHPLTDYLLAIKVIGVFTV